MKKFKCILLVVFWVLIGVAGGCSAMPDSNGDFIAYGYASTGATNNEFTDFAENDFVDAAQQPVSYFSMDVSSASYSIIRSHINRGLAIDKNMVKLEEMINYFSYDYPKPQGDDPLSISGSIFPCPWDSSSMLASVGVCAKEIEFTAVRNNLVFLIDTSASMDSPDKLGLLQQAFCMLADNLNNHDVVSIVAYAGTGATLLEGVDGSQRLAIKNAIASIDASGATNGSGGITHAYNLAQRYYIEGGNNRVILATDGDFNLGISSQQQLKEFIAQKSNENQGIYLSVMGFGLGNLKSTTMDTLARSGNGNVYYIDSVLEAKKVMANEMCGTLVTVADDVKAAVEFNPHKIKSYRLLGYETRLMAQNDWLCDTTDAGEIGAGHTTTALYEIKLNDDLQQTATEGDQSYLTARLRFKLPNAEAKSSEIFCILGNSDILSAQDLALNEDLIFIACVVEFGLILMDSAHKGNASLGAIKQRLSQLNSVLTDPYRNDFFATVQRV